MPAETPTVIPEPAPPLLLDVKGVARMLSLSPRSIWRMASAGELPRPVKIGGRVVRWRAADLQAWAQALEAGK